MSVAQEIALRARLAAAEAEIRALRDHLARPRAAPYGVRCARCGWSNPIPPGVCAEPDCGLKREIHHHRNEARLALGLRPLPACIDLATPAAE